MISKRTAVILIIAIVIIVGIESKFGLDKINQMQENVDRTVVQVTLTSGEDLIDLEGCELTYTNEQTDSPLSAKLSQTNDTGYEGKKNNSAAFKTCSKGKNSFNLVIPANLIPEYNHDLTINFGYDTNTSDFNNYSLMIDLTTMDSDNIKTAITQTVYYPDENGETHQKQNKVSTIVNSENSSVNSIIK